MQDTDIYLKTVALVRNGVHEAHRNTPWRDIESEIIVDDAWCDALDGLAQFSHISVIFYFHRIAPPDSPHVQPLQRADMPLLGRFARRAPSRPNPIGLSAVELIEVRGNVLHVRGLEALDGSPVLDIKPYLPCGEVSADAQVGEWVKKLWRADSPKRT